MERFRRDRGSHAKPRAMMSRSNNNPRPRVFSRQGPVQEEGHSPFHSTTQIAKPFASRSNLSVTPPPKICLILDVPCRPTTMVS